MKFRNARVLVVVLVVMPCAARAQPQGRELTPEQKIQFVPPPDARVIRDLEYARVGDRSLKLDLTLPAESGSAARLLVYIHGGAWLSGGKNRAPLMWLVEEGYAVASIEYRLSGEAKFPAQIHDCKGAIRWLRAHAEEYGYDAKRMGVAGISAGGHLVALLGTSGEVKELEGDVGGNLEQSSRVQAVVDFFGPTDFPKLAEQGHPEFTTSAAALLLGDPIVMKKDLAMLVSPIHHVSSDDAPTLILQGDGDPVVKLVQSTSFHEALRRVDVESQLEVIACPGHGGPEFLDGTRRRLISDFFGKHIAQQ